MQYQNCFQILCKPCQCSFCQNFVHKSKKDCELYGCLYKLRQSYLTHLLIINYNSILLIQLLQQIISIKLKRHWEQRMLIQKLLNCAQQPLINHITLSPPFQKFKDSAQIVNSIVELATSIHQYYQWFNRPLILIHLLDPYVMKSNSNQPHQYFQCVHRFVELDFIYMFQKVATNLILQSLLNFGLLLLLLYQLQHLNVVFKFRKRKYIFVFCLQELIQVLLGSL